MKTAPKLDKSKNSGSEPQSAGQHSAGRAESIEGLEAQPEPTMGPKQPPAEVVAILASAVETVWLRPSVEEDVTHTADAVWKFANRWWHGRPVMQRSRPRRPSSF